MSGPTTQLRKFRQHVPWCENVKKVWRFTLNEFGSPARPPNACSVPVCPRASPDFKQRLSTIIGGAGIPKKPSVGGLFVFLVTGLVSACLGLDLSAWGGVV